MTNLCLENIIKFRTKVCEQEFGFPVKGVSMMINRRTGGRRGVRRGADTVCVKVARRRRVVLLLFLICLWLVFLFARVRGSLTYAKAPGKALSYRQIQVCAGDTLDSITRCYCEDSYSYSAFKRTVVIVNQLEDEDRIHSGAYLIVPVYQ